MKRSRGRGRRQQNPVNRSYDSNGPDVRVRGTASQVYEKYQALARDAMSSGDRVMAENYQQHAEHYYRILQSFQPTPSESEGEATAQEANGGDKPVAEAGGDEAGAEPLVLVREQEGGDESAEAKPEGKSRRRGPLGKKRTAKAAPENGAAEADEIVAAADAAESDAPEATISGE